MKLIAQVFILFVIFFTGCQTKTLKKSAYEFLKDVSSDMNKKCPIQVDSILKLENTVALPVATFRFNYILKYDTVKYDIHAFGQMTVAGFVCYMADKYSNRVPENLDKTIIEQLDKLTVFNIIKLASKNNGQ